MWSRFAARFALFVLKRTDLRAEEENLITASLLDALRAIPLTDILSVSEEGEILVSGRSLNIEKYTQLRAHARAALDNKTLSLIREQVKYEAFVGAAVKSATPLDLLFYRAALWWGQQEDKYLNLLAQTTEEPDL